MGKRRHGGKAYRMDQYEGHKPDPLVRVVATHPTEETVLLGVGNSLRALNCSTGEQVDMQQDGAHQGAVRFVAISPDGKHVMSGSDDKTCKLWGLDTHSCKATWRMHKKLSAGCFSQDSAHSVFADKFGDVAVAAVGGTSSQPAPSEQPELLLGHLCSIVTTVTVTPDNKYVATADRDGRVRVSVLPAEPIKGAYEIQTYCLGHKNFVSSAAFIRTHTDGGVDQVMLVTGSGDGTVRVWDAEQGKLLSTYTAAEVRTCTTTAATPGDEAAEGVEAQGVEEVEGAGEGKEGENGQQGQGEDAEEEGVPAAGGGGDEDVDADDRRDIPDCAAVLCVAVSRDGQTLAILVEGEQEIQVLSLDASTHQLRQVQRLAVASVINPCRADWDVAGRLWLVGGPPVDTSTSVHVAVLELKDGQLVEVTSAVMSEEVRGKLERRNAEEEAMCANGEVQLSKPLQRKKYENQEAWGRKRVRNDHKENLRLAQLRAQQPSADETK